LLPSEIPIQLAGQSLFAAGNGRRRGWGRWKCGELDLTLYEMMTRCGAGTEVVKTDVASELARVTKLTKLSV
jgi:hypothetical protein